MFDLTPLPLQFVFEWVLLVVFSPSLPSSYTNVAAVVYLSVFARALVHHTNDSPPSIFGLYQLLIIELFEADT